MSGVLKIEISESVETLQELLTQLLYSENATKGTGTLLGQN